MCSYIVAVMAKEEHGAGSLLLVVQGAHHSAAYLAARCDAFLRGFEAQLARVSNASFARAKQTLSVDFRQKDVRMAQRTSRLWTAVSQQTYLFDRASRLVLSCRAPGIRAGAREGRQV